MSSSVLTASSILPLPQSGLRLAAPPALVAEPPAACDRRGLLATPSFVGLLATQFLGAMNDNLFRWLIVPIGKHQVGHEHEAWVMSAGLACLVLPYLLLAAPAGYISDRFGKHRVMTWLKVAELAIMLLGIAAIWSGSLPLMMAMIFLAGSHSALFAPAKFGSLPELVRADRLAAANGLVALSTIVAIIAGTVGGFYLFYFTGPDGAQGLWLPALVLGGVAALGIVTSLFVAPLAPANPTRAFPRRPFTQTFRDLRQLVRSPWLFRSAAGSAYFWSLASLAQMNLDGYGLEALQLEQHQIGWLLAVLAVGVGVGNVLAAKLSHGKVELGLTSLAAAGMALGAAGLFFTTHSFVATCGMLLLLGAAAGMFDVPLQAFLQARSPQESRGSLLAASNFLTFACTIGVSGLFALLRGTHIGLGLSAPDVFLAAGVLTAGVAAYAAWVAPADSLRVVLGLLVKLGYRVDVDGLGHLPAQGGAILAPNHVSWVDALLLLLHSPRPIRMICYADYAESWWLRRLAKDAGVIPVRPGDRRSVVACLQTAREAVEQGDLVCIFPEGGLTRTGEMQPFRPGVLSIAEKTGAPLIPVHLRGLWGSVFSYSGGRFFWKLPTRWPYPVSIRFGKPIVESPRIEELQQAVEKLGVQS